MVCLRWSTLEESGGPEKSRKASWKTTFYEWVGADEVVRGMDDEGRANKVKPQRRRGLKRSFKSFTL